MQHKSLRFLIFVFCSLFFGTVAGKESVAEKKDEKIPDLEFLIFLGTFEDTNGNWQDPLEIEQMPTPENQSDLNDKEISEESGDE